MNRRTNALARLLIGLAIAGATTPTADAGQSTAIGDPADTRQAVLREERERKREDLTPHVVSDGERRVRSMERVQFPRNIFVRGYRGVRPVIGGLPSGSGFVVGGGYATGAASEWLEFETAARVSTYGHTAVDAAATFPPRARQTPVRGYIATEVRDLKSLNFFGFGPGTSAADVSTYRLEDRSLTVGANADLGRVVSMGADGGLVRIDASPGSRRVPLNQRFDPATVPGFGLENDFYRYGGHVAFDLRDRESPAAGLWARLDAHRFENRDGNPFDFSRVVADVHGYVPLGSRNRVLALRFRTSHSTTASGEAVPFYLMETIGGARTLRGFREYRFRDSRNLLVSAEYRWEVWTYVDFGLFYDAGKVFSESHHFDLQDLKSAYGFGVRAHTPGNVLVRIDLARSNEGLVLHIGGGPSF